MKTYETLEIEERGSVSFVWLSRPERRNALNGRALEEIADCFDAFQTRFATRVVVLAGRGVSFCAGADLREPPNTARAAEGTTQRERRHASQLGLRAARAIERCEAVTVARIQGHAIGGGLVLAMACDFRVASEDAVFSVPEVDLGIPLTWGAVPRLAHELGAARARELVLLCERVDAAQALHFGIVQRVVPADALDAATLELAERLTRKPELAVHMTKTQLRAYGAAARLGDVTESDGDLLTASLRVGAAREIFRKGS